ncbi:hypothetical protein FKP32DRAFT_1666607 [Trametes sanguinea]|nr:hypothetical protein FKP32DRAFT_1666607 [Trametes sanguinea]
MPTLEDYLTKQIFIQKNVVTYRSLSRQLGIHVNQAKTELANFRAQSTDETNRSFATYLISGELFPVPRTKHGESSTQDDGMDVDSQNVDTTDDEEEVPTTTLTLVGEKDLEEAKSKYARIFSIHVYCLSPSPLTDAGLICDPSAIVYKADAKDAPASSIALGRVVGPDVKIGKAPRPVASSSKAPEPVSRKPTLKVKTEKEEEPKAAQTKSASASSSNVEKEKSGSVKPKASGKLDFSKAKKTPESGKSKDKETTPKVKKEESVSPIENAAKRTAKLELKDKSPSEESKRGVKRKAAAPTAASDTEEKPKSREKEKATPTPAPSDVKLRKNRVVSDSEDEGPSPAPRKANGKGKARPSVPVDALESDAEKSLRAMMDIDDSLVEKASASRVQRKRPAPPDDEDVEMAPEPEQEPEPEPEPAPEPEVEEEEVSKPKPKKKKEKKVIPVGRNGLKKKRVVKSRMTMDSKGYMVTEDYSSYESVDEEEAEEEVKKPKAKKASGGATAKAKKPASPANNSDEEAPAKGKSISRAASASKVKKPAGAKSGGQGNIHSFFSKAK